MKKSSYTHVLFTWLLANIIQLLLIGFYLYDESHSVEFVSNFLLVGLIAFGISIPCMVVAYFCFELIANAMLPVNTRFLVWLVVCPFLVLAEGVISWLIMGESDLNSLAVCVPGMIAAFLAVVIRYNEFSAHVSRQKSSGRI